MSDALSAPIFCHTLWNILSRPEPTGSCMRELFDEVAGHSPLDPEEAVRRTLRRPQRKRFYAQAGVAETPKGFGIMLDGKPVRTPSRRLLSVPNLEIAEAIA